MNKKTELAMDNVLGALGDMGMTQEYLKRNPLSYALALEKNKLNDRAIRRALNLLNFSRDQVDLTMKHLIKSREEWLWNLLIMLKLKKKKNSMN